VRDIDAARLVLLYCLRYEQHTNNDITGLIDALKKKGVPETYIKVSATNPNPPNFYNFFIFEWLLFMYLSFFVLPKVVNSILNYNQQDDLFGDNKLQEKIKKRIFMELKGVENVFTRHTPILKDILEELCKGRLRESDFPCINGQCSPYNRR